MGALKYSQALTGDTGSFMKLSAEGKVTADHYQTLQSGELGIGFALVAAQRALAQRYPDRVVSLVPADATLRAGRTARGTYHPQFSPNYEIRVVRALLARTRNCATGGWVVLQGGLSLGAGMGVGPSTAG